MSMMYKEDPHWCIVTVLSHRWSSLGCWAGINWYEEDPHWCSVTGSFRGVGKCLLFVGFGVGKANWGISFWERLKQVICKMPANAGDVGQHIVIVGGPG